MGLLHITLLSGEIADNLLVNMRGIRGGALSYDSVPQCAATVRLRCSGAPDGRPLVAFCRSLRSGRWYCMNSSSRLSLLVFGS
mmetsp:Transcript_24862/g.71814  ORF Transcript_24862/g.71814 Transcript_24862/m.71814 type:complete len:83 (-) Transcript_24862:5-253(-)